MKTDIYTLLGMIKDDKAPKIIRFKNNYYEYQNEEQDYLCQINGVIWLFDEYVITDILTDEVEILETTITFKPDKKINKLSFIPIDGDETTYELMRSVNVTNRAFTDKINEIIYYIQKEK